jgi:hypothetical protein
MATRKRVPPTLEEAVIELGVAIFGVEMLLDKITRLVGRLRRQRGWVNRLKEQVRKLEATKPVSQRRTKQARRGEV